MAERRMLSKSIVNGDRFTLLSPLAAKLYVIFSVNADDDGFVDNPVLSMRQAGATQNELSELIENEFLIPFEKNVFVLSDWLVNNFIDKSKYHQTLHQEEFSKLIVNPNRTYSIVPECDQNRYADKNSQDKNSPDEGKQEKKSAEKSNEVKFSAEEG